jgi:membrane-associated phospholipid phosphatase
VLPHNQNLEEDPPIVFPPLAGSQSPALIAAMTSSPRPGPAESERLLSAALVMGLLAAAAALMLFSWLGREILTGVTPMLDERIRLAVHGFASPRLTAIMRGLSLYGGPTGLTPIGLALALAFLIRRWHRGALLVVITMAGAGLLDVLLKQSFGRVRPAAFFDFPLPATHSFPSGHAFFAASFFGGLAVLVSARVRNRFLRAAVWIVAVSLILLVGLSRVYLGVHYPSDIIAGYAAATVWVAAVAFGDRLVSHRRRRRRSV